MVAKTKVGVETYWSNPFCSGFLGIWLFIRALDDKGLPVVISWGYPLLVLGALIAMFVWRNHRYTLFIAPLAWAVGLLIWMSSELRRDYPMSTGNWIWFGFLVVFSISFICCLSIVATRYAVIKGESWGRERDQIGCWLQTLMNSGSSNVAEFTVENFWTGHCTYRLMNFEDEYWVIGRFKKRTYDLAGCSIFASNEVSLDPLPSGKWTIHFGKRVFSNVILEQIGHPAWASAR